MKMMSLLQGCCCDLSCRIKERDDLMMICQWRLYSSCIIIFQEWVFFAADSIDVFSYSWRVYCRIRYSLFSSTGHLWRLDCRVLVFAEISQLLQETSERNEYLIQMFSCPNDSNGMTYTTTNDDWTTRIFCTESSNWCFRISRLCLFPPSNGNWQLVS
jgi:hypothetical protein